MILIGIDPGKTTGYAAADTYAAGDKEGNFVSKLVRVESLSIHRAMEEVEGTASALPVFVIFEDARMRKWFGNAGPEKLQGVGSVKRDCAIWEDFLNDKQIPFRANRPIEHGTKWTPDYFKRVTGWTARTSEHGRDAAVLIWGINQPMAVGMLRIWQQSRSLAKASAHT